VMASGWIFNPPPGWPAPPAGWLPPEDWRPDPAWPPAPATWVFWAPDEKAAPIEPEVEVQPAVESQEEEPDELAVLLHKFEQCRSQLFERERELTGLRRRLATLEARPSTAVSGPVGDVVDLDDERVLQEVGIYRYHHPLENAPEFRTRLDEIQTRIKEHVKAGEAVLASDMFTFNNSLAKGRRMTADLSKLMLRAYNAEADNAVRGLRSGNIETAKRRLEATAAAVARLGSLMEMRISPDFHALRIQELELTADYQMKLQEDREEQRAERERLREERKAEQELAAERERLDKERSHYANALAAVQKNGETGGTEDLARRLAEIDAAIAHNDYRRANIRAGYVYVISNPGAFGSDVVKIGLTRRLEPMDRVRELGDASVPFPYDVHVLYFSDDAVRLETELHHVFADRRVNRVNQRREFFFATPSEVREALVSKVGSLLQFDEAPEAVQYLQSKRYWPASRTGLQPSSSSISEPLID
jgi:hypothetical protein